MCPHSTTYTTLHTIHTHYTTHTNTCMVCGKCAMCPNSTCFSSVATAAEQGVRWEETTVPSCCSIVRDKVVWCSIVWDNVVWCSIV
jgi:hypothetical protein